MRMSKYLAAVAIAALAASPALAKESGEKGKSNAGLIALGGIAAAVGVGLALGSGGDSTPASN